MPADLGTWSRPQAAALLKVLKRAGIRASTEPAPDGSGLTVTVPDAQADRAHAALAADMDTIARAAREERASDEKRRRGKATVSDLDDARRRRSAPGERPLVMERVGRLGPVLGIVVAALLVAAVVPDGLRFPVLIVVVLGLAYLLGRGDDRG